MTKLHTRPQASRSNRASLNKNKLKLVINQSAGASRGKLNPPSGRPMKSKAQPGSARGRPPHLQNTIKPRPASHAETKRLSASWGAANKSSTRPIPTTKLGFKDKRYRGVKASIGANSDIVIDSDDEETYYVFSDNESKSQSTSTVFTRSSPFKANQESNASIRPSVGSSHTPSGGSSNKPSGGSSHRPSGGSSHRPSVGSSHSPSGGLSHGPSGGSCSRPSGELSSRPSGGASSRPPAFTNMSQSQITTAVKGAGSAPENESKQGQFVSKPLAVVCEETSSDMDSVRMAPPPSPFLRNSNVRPVARIPISPYTRSPPSLSTVWNEPATETPHSVPAASRRVTRSSPLKGAESRPSTPRKQQQCSPPGHRDSSNRMGSFARHSSARDVDVRARGSVTPSPNTVGKGRGLRAPSPAASERRLSVRQTESVFKYKDILVKKTHCFTQVILNTTVRNQKNTLTVKALQELTAVLNNAKYDDGSQVVLLTGSDNGTFCSGLDLTYLTTGDIHQAARRMSDALSEFIRAVVLFPKPLVAAVNGEAVGCGVAILPFCDIVYASDKATFFTPYTQLGQVPEAGLPASLPQIIGTALASEMLMAGRMLTALEAYQMGLVAQVFWPTSIMQEIIPRITNMATSCSSRVLNATKYLIRCENKQRLLASSETEASMLAEIWPTPECQKNIKIFLEHCQSI